MQFQRDGDMLQPKLLFCNKQEINKKFIMNSL